jgi:hypothetical protein
MDTGRVEESQALLRIALEAARSLGNLRLAARVLGQLACINSHNISEAREMIADAIEIYHAMDSERNAALALVLLSRAEFLSGNPERAMELSISAALATLRTLRAGTMFVPVLNLCAAYLIACHHWDEARVHAREALDLANEMQHYTDLASALQHLAALAILSADHAARNIPESKVAAQLLGHVNARIAASGSSRDCIEQQEYDRVATVRKAISADGLERLMSKGVAMTQDQAIEMSRTL